MSKSDVLSTIMGARYKKVLYCRKSCARAAGGLPADVAFFQFAHTTTSSLPQAPGEVERAPGGSGGCSRKRLVCVRFFVSLVFRRNPI